MRDVKVKDRMTHRGDFNYIRQLIDSLPGESWEADDSRYDYHSGRLSLKQLA